MRQHLPLVAIALVLEAGAIDNGIGRTPPRGWRSWNQFQCAINQTLIEAQYEVLASRHRLVDGKPTSLVDLGYETAGIDDCWQQCNSGPGGQGFHDESGNPIVDLQRFPSLKSMTDKAKSLGIKPGWYGNNCACRELPPSRCAVQTGEHTCFAGDVAATLAYGFESIKLDGCGVERNITLFAELFNKSGVPVMIENCHNGNPTYPSRDAVSGQVDCPMNFFRSSQDIRPTFGSVLINLETTTDYNTLTGPGCWSYPDMLEVGVTNSQIPGCSFGEPGCGLNMEEAHTHFYAWCIVSSPLILGNDLRDSATVDLIWPIITNREALAVSDAWVGDSGRLAAVSKERVHMPNCSWFSNGDCDLPSWMVWKKDVGEGQTAMLLINNANSAADVTGNFSDAGITCPASKCLVRDIRAKKDLGRFDGQYIAESLPSHGSAFLMISY